MVKIDIYEFFLGGKMNTTIKLALAFLVSVLFINTNVNAGSYSGPDLSGQKVTISGQIVLNNKLLLI